LSVSVVRGGVLWLDFADVNRGRDVFDAVA
jgi:hypothetical protein